MEKQIDLEFELSSINESLKKRKDLHDEFLRIQFIDNVKAKNALIKFIENRNIDLLSSEELALVIDVCQKSIDSYSQNIVNIKYSLSLNA